MINMDFLLRNVPPSQKHLAIDPFIHLIDESNLFFLLTGVKKSVYTSIYSINSKGYLELMDNLCVHKLLKALHCKGLFFLTYDDSRHIIALFSPNGEDFNALHAARTITEEIQRIYETDLFKGDARYANVSALVPVVGGIDGIHKAYKRACALCDLSFFHMKPEVITGDWVLSHRGDADYHTVIDRLDQFKAALMQGEEDAALAHLRTLFLTELKQGLSMPLCTDALSYTKHTLDTLCTAYGADVVPDLETLCSLGGYLRIEECFEALCAALPPLCRAIREGGAHPEPILRAVCYVKHHYGNPDLSLADVAAYAGIHPNYLSGFFKEQTGRSIRQLITDVRLENACRLLKTTDRKIAEIAVQVGIRDVRYFRQLFEQKHGMSPNAYRQSIGQSCSWGCQDKPEIRK